MRLLQRVEEHSPDVYELDTTDISAWQENVEKKAEQIIQAFLKVIFKEEEKKHLFISKQKSFVNFQNEKVPFEALPKTPVEEPVYEQNTCRRKLDNAIPSLLNTLDELQSKKMLEEQAEDDEDSEEEDEEVLTNVDKS